MAHKLLMFITDEISIFSSLPVMDELAARSSDFVICISGGAQLPDRHRHRQISYAEACATAWDCILANNPIDRQQLRGRLVSFPHGSMFGNSSWALVRATNCDVYCGFSPSEELYLKHYLKEKVSGFRFVPTGAPHNDDLQRFVDPKGADRISARRALLTQSGLAEDKKTILISSHWTSNGNLRVFGGSLIDAICYNMPDHQVLFTCHGKVWKDPQQEYLVNHMKQTPGFTSQWLRRMLLEKEERFPVRCLFDGRVSEYLCAADVFVGDYSSAMVEAAVLDIPLITRSQSSIFDGGVRNLIESASLQFSNLEELIQHVASCSGGVDSRRAGREKLRDVFVHNLGTAAAAICDVAESELAAAR